MTAPEMVGVVAAAMYCSDADEVGQCGDETYYQRQARAVLAALTEAGTVEWSVATRDGITPAIAMSEPAARRASAVHGRKLVSRLTLPWTAAK